MMLTGLNELFQRNAVRPSTTSMLPQLPLLNMLLYLALSCLLFRFSGAVETRKLCYGETLRFPYDENINYSNNTVYFTPENREQASRTVIFREGKPKHPRVGLKHSTIYVKDIREEDQGMFSIRQSDEKLRNILNLTVKECADRVQKYYGDEFSPYFSYKANYLEFASINNKTNVKVLWNASAVYTEWSRVTMSWRSGSIKEVTQLDNGYYNLRKEDNGLIWRKLLIVEAKSEKLEGEAGSPLTLHHTPLTTSRNVTFKPETGSGIKLLVGNDRVMDNGGWLHNSFHGRLSLRENGLEIYNLKSRDAGIYEFTDKNGNMIMTVEVKVLTPPSSIPLYVGVGLGSAFVIIGCCLCVRKGCCKRTPPKEPTQTPTEPHTEPYRVQTSSHCPADAAAPVRYYHYQPVSSVTPPHQPATASTVPGPLVAAAAGQDPSPSVGMNLDVLSPDAEPKFDINRSVELSAQPLDSNLTICDVYHSDKLNNVSLL